MQGPSELGDGPLGHSHLGAGSSEKHWSLGWTGNETCTGMSHLHLFHPAWLRGYLAELHIKVN